jgi:hypothetical protein
MEDFEPDDGSTRSLWRLRAHLLRRAQNLFPRFYEAANHDDARLLDSLVLAHVALLIGTAWPRPPVESPLRLQIERDCDAAERTFVQLRQAVRVCVTFQILPASVQHELRVSLFELEPVDVDCD